jgi:hypothetical protein
MRKSTVSIALLLAVAGCESFGVCTDELLFRVTTTEVIISIGESFTPNVAAETCGGARNVPVEVHWSTADSTVAATDVQTGRTTGRRPGVTAITGVDESRFGAGTLTVHVRVTK